jgi:hypothetical protein
MGGPETAVPPVLHVPGVKGIQGAASPKKFHIRHVVIPKHKEQGFIEARYDKFEVIQGKVSRSENQVHIAESVLDGVGIDQWIDLIGDAEYFHGRRAGFPNWGTASPWSKAWSFSLLKSSTGRELA